MMFRVPRQPTILWLGCLMVVAVYAILQDEFTPPKDLDAIDYSKYKYVIASRPDKDRGPAIWPLFHRNGRMDCCATLSALLPPSVLGSSLFEYFHESIWQGPCAACPGSGLPSVLVALQRVP